MSFSITLAPVLSVVTWLETLQRRIPGQVGSWRFLSVNNVHVHQSEAVRSDRTKLVWALLVEWVAQSMKTLSPMAPPAWRQLTVDSGLGQEVWFRLSEWENLQEAQTDTPGTPIAVLNNQDDRSLGFLIYEITNVFSSSESEIHSFNHLQIFAATDKLEMNHRQSF